MFSDSVSFNYLTGDYSELDMMNHHLNTHIQRAAVSSDVEYLLVISGSLPIFTNQVFSEMIDWNSDINIGFSQDKNSSMILFKKKFNSQPLPDVPGIPVSNASHTHLAPSPDQQLKPPCLPPSPMDW
jgi:hypothetical protein